MTQQKLRVGVVGFGRVAQLFHVPALTSLSDRLEIVRVADPSTGSLAEADELLGLGDSRLHADALELIANDDVDVVSLCGPPHVRKEQLLAAARAGKHTVSEKPILTRPADAVEVADAFDANGVRLAVVHNWLFFPEVVALREFIASAELGRLRAVTVNLMGMAEWAGSESYDPGWRKDPAISGGGVLIDLVHGAYLVEALLGASVERVHAVVDAAPGQRVEDFAAVQLETAGGLGFLNVALGRGTSSYEVLGSEGAAVATFNLSAEPPRRTSEITVNTADGVRRIDLPASEGPWAAFADSVAHVYSNLVDGVMDPEVSLVATGRDGVHMVEIVMAAYAAATTGVPVELPLSKEHPMYVDGIAGIRDLPAARLSNVSRLGLFQ